MKETLKIGDKVKVISKGDCYNENIGIIVNINDSKISRWKYSIKFNVNFNDTNFIGIYEESELQLIKPKTKKVNGHYNCWYCGSKNYLATQSQPIKEESKDIVKLEKHKQYCFMHNGEMVEYHCFNLPEVAEKINEVIDTLNSLTKMNIK